MEKGFTVRRGGSMKRKVKAAEPADVHSVYDTGDGYVIVMTWPDRYPGEGTFESLALSENPDSPGGFSLFGPAKIGPHLGQQIAFQDLPQNVQEHAVRRLSSKEVRSQEGLIVDAIHNASMLLPKALEYARKGEIETTLAVCRSSADFLAKAISHLEGVGEIG